jgi:NACHT domain
MNKLYKRTAIPLSGYFYQNIVGLGLLCDWLNDPTLYKWVKFEADDPEVAQGLDDVVAQCFDETYVLIQVKFTVDANDSDNALNWSWLLNHRPRGRSNLQKWADAWSSHPADRVRLAKLITNRKPDREFASHLDVSQEKVDIGALSPELRVEIIKQLGSEERAIAFFAAFIFDHSYQGFKALELTLIDRFVPQHTTRHGWLALFREAVDWAVLRNNPSPDGKITLNWVRGIIDKRRPSPLEQSFRVPDGYRPSDDHFANQFIEDLVSAKRNSIVLWGSPGQGKSTFISYVSHELDEREIPYIRHHYFLNLHDTSDRFTLQSVANSLMAQMEQQHTVHVQGLDDRPENLRDWIVQCANGYREQGKPFVIIVDGLDHVWRENDRNKRPLDSLFSELFPTVENAILLIGTQKVSAEQLPKGFNRYLPESSWIELPPMSLTCIKGWLTTMQEANRFDLVSREDDQLVEVAMAFERASNGHPLVLTYTFEALVQSHHTLTADLVEQELPPLTGDVTDYYRMLWDRLTHIAKDALHLAADAGFFWPILGLESCLKASAGEIHSEIGHLFYQTEAGEVPFHGSLDVFVKAEREHEQRISALLPAVISWLENSAPPFHRWGWLWLYMARCGDPSALLSGANRQWVIDSLARAYPIEQIVSILCESESIAFEAGDFPSAIRYRWLKTRVLNGPEFQVDDYNRVYRWALYLSDDDYPLNLLSIDRRGTSTETLYMLGKQYLAAGRIDDAVNCVERMRQRINDQLQANSFSESDLRGTIEQHLELIADTRQYKAERIVGNIRQFFGASTATDIFSGFLQRLSRHKDLELLMRFVNVPMAIGMRRELELSCIRLAGYLGVKLQEWPNFERFRKHPISAFWRMLYVRDQYTESAFRVYRVEYDSERGGSDIGHEIGEYFHGLFFHVLVQCMAAGGVKNVVAPPEYLHQKLVSVFSKNIIQLADIVGIMLSRGEYPTFNLPFQFSSSIAIPKKYDERMLYLGFKRALTSIAVDLFLVMREKTHLDAIHERDWKTSSESDHLDMYKIHNQYLASGLKIISSETVQAYIQKSQLDIENSINMLNERSESYINLCELALEYDFLELAKELHHRIIICIIGYGWRKDSTLRNVLKAIESIIPVDSDFARQMIHRIAPIVNHIDDLTEDDGVRESDLAKSLIQLMPATFVAYYRSFLENEEWYSAELVFARLLAMHDLNNPYIPLVTSSVWSNRETYELRERANNGDEFAEDIIVQNAHRFGYTYDDLGKERDRGSTHQERDVEIDVKDFLPEDLPRLLDVLEAQNAYTAERRIIRNWFQYWVDNNQGILVLRAMEKFLSLERLPSALTELFDMAFTLSVELEGKSKAYNWLVVAQISRHGWGEYYSRNDSCNRFLVFAKHYRHKWREFIAETTKPSDWTFNDNITIPHEMLVNFLIAVQEYDVAKAVVMEMVEITVEDFSDVPLEVPKWLSAGI